MNEGSPKEKDRSWRKLLLDEPGSLRFHFCPLLEIWRPLYFLTDDNLGGGFPLLTGIGQHLLHGQSPFRADYIFGGDYNLSRDCTNFVWHPFFLAASLLVVPA